MEHGELFVRAGDPRNGTPQMLSLLVGYLRQRRQQFTLARGKGRNVAKRINAAQAFYGQVLLNRDTPRMVQAHSYELQQAEMHEYPLPM
jgi:hypothetical protein